MLLSNGLGLGSEARWQVMGGWRGLVCLNVFWKLLQEVRKSHWSEVLNGLSLITSIGDDDVKVSMENKEIDM